MIYVMYLDAIRILDALTVEVVAYLHEVEELRNDPLLLLQLREGCVDRLVPPDQLERGDCVHLEYSRRGER